MDLKLQTINEKNVNKCIGNKILLFSVNGKILHVHKHFLFINTPSQQKRKLTWVKSDYSIK